MSAREPLISARDRESLFALVARLRTLRDATLGASERNAIDRELNAVRRKIRV